jgi:hypothetical protein
MSSIEIKFNSKTYSSIAELAHAFSLNTSSIGRRLRDGWTPEEAVGLAHRKRKGHGNKVVINGVSYPTIKEACEALKLDPSTIRARIQRGYSIEDAFEGNLHPRCSPAAKSIQFNGLTYPSIESLAQKFGTKASILQRRIKRGWTTEEALGVSPAPPRFRNFEGHARKTNWKTTRQTISGIEPIPDTGGYKLYLVTNTVNSKEYVGITIGTIDKRLRSHFAAARRGRKSSLYNAIRKYGEDAFKVHLIRSDAKSFDELQNQEIIEIANRNSIKMGYNTAIGGALGTSKEITIDGKRFPSRSQAAEYYGIDVEVFNMRINRLRWSPEESAGLVEKNWLGKEIPVVLSGIQYTSISDAAKALRKDYKLVHERFKSKGWSLEQAFDIAPPPQTKKFTGVSIDVNGKTYKSIAEAAKDLGIPSEPFRLRIKAGMSPDEAALRVRQKKT